MSAELKLGGIYRHYKTKGLYQPIRLVKNTGDGQNDQLMVLYFSYTAGEMFVRPLAEFVALVAVDGKTAPRFAPRYELVRDVA